MAHVWHMTPPTSGRSRARVAPQSSIRALDVPDRQVCTWTCRRLRRCGRTTPMQTPTLTLTDLSEDVVNDAVDVMSPNFVDHMTLLTPVSCHRVDPYIMLTYLH